ncbi:MAG: M23 family metallopeptidase, partial [Actinomycetota bacterium]|nr:M23 family metallopeptidase [Actinomycetota bacterium]
MRASTHRRAFFVLLLVALMLVGLTIPAFGGTNGAPGADPSLYSPPFSLSFPYESSRGFGDTFGAIRDGGSRLHQGIDISAPKGTPVLAAAAGVVSRISVGDKAGSYVELRHAGGWRTLYLHLNNDEPPPPPVADPICKVVPAEESPAEEPPAEEPPAEEPPAEEPPAEEPPAEEPPAEEPPAEEPPAEEPPA